MGYQEPATGDTMDSQRFQWIIRWLDWERLTEWEEDFILSVENYFEKRGYLSKKQENILERIYREKGLQGPSSGEEWYD